MTKAQFRSNPGAVAFVPTIVAVAGATLLLRHTVGAVSDDLLRFGILAISAAGAVECALGRWRYGCCLALLTLTLYGWCMYPIPLVPDQPGLFSAIYFVTGTAAVAVAPVLLLRRRYLLAVVVAVSGAVLFPYLF